MRNVGSVTLHFDHEKGRPGGRVIRLFTVLGIPYESPDSGGRFPAMVRLDLQHDSTPRMKDDGHQHHPRQRRHTALISPRHKRQRGR